MSESNLPIATRATLEALEVPSLLAMVGELAVTDVGRLRVLGLEPEGSAERLAGRRQQFEEVRRLVEDGALAPRFEEPLAPRLEALGEAGSSFGGEDLVILASMLRATRDAAARIRSAEPACPALLEALGPLEDLEPLRRRIGRTLDRRGRVRDEASPRLSRLSAGARRARERLYRELRDFAERHPDNLSEDTVPLHAGRLVVKIRSGAKGRMRGLVHGRSATGKSFYFEPLEVVEGNNRLQEAQEKVEEERRRLLLELIEAARESQEALAGHLDLLARLDLQQAAVRFGAIAEGRLAEVAEPGMLELIEARHPLLDPRLAALRRAALDHEGHTGPIEPLNVRLAGERRVLVVTGPNAGGKTVALKTIGLLTLASQCGLPVSAAPGSRLPRLGSLVATVGDEQDLLEDRSTFSARLARLKEAWERASPDALVLLDELGSGTDPEEGAALAIALVEGLLERRSLAVVTTHLTKLAAAALELDGAFCAAMEFDSETGRPTYCMIPGAPGGSEALALARRLELPPAWLERAEVLLGPEHRKLQRLLAEVERVRDELGREHRDARRAATALERRRQEADRRLAELRSERRELAQRARRELDEFRRKVSEKLRRETERLREELEAGRRKGLASAASRRLFRGEPELEVLAVEEPEVDLPVEPGCAVEHRGLGWKGRVERLEKGRVEVSVGGKRLRCRVDELRRIEEQAPETARGPGVQAPDEGPGVEAELNLIGRRVESALEELDVYLDRALRTSHPRVRIIHGHGSGRLRKAVREHLVRHPAVASHRPGRPEEGGDGATVVEFSG